MKKTLFYISFILVLLLPVFVHADMITYPDGCTVTTKFSSTTGQPCQKSACSPGDVFSSETGQRCSDINISLPQGCITLEGYSPLTGTKCDGTILRVQTVQQANNALPDISTQVDKVGTSAAKLITKDLGNLYEFDAYLYDANGNNISLMHDSRYKNSIIQFLTNGSVFNNARWQDEHYDALNNLYFYPAIEDKAHTGNTVTVLFPDAGISKVLNVSESIN